MTSVTVVETLIPTTPILGTTLSRTIRLRELSQELIYNLCSQTKREPTRSKETKIKKIPKKKKGDFVRMTSRCRMLETTIIYSERILTTSKEEKRSTGKTLSFTVWRMTANWTATAVN